MRVGEKSCKYDIYQGMQHPSNSNNFMRIDVIDDCVNEVQRGRLAKSCELKELEKCLQV